MSELSEPRWSVLSERGVEAASLTYLVAKEMFARLSDEGLHGLCVVTDEAGARVAITNAGDAERRKRRKTKSAHRDVGREER